MSESRNWTKAERDVMARQLDEYYSGFVSFVAENRKISKEEEKIKTILKFLLGDPSDWMRHVEEQTKIKNKKKEYFVALYLNARNQVIHIETVSIGSLVSSIVHPREVFEPAIRHSAAFVLVAHNHPSGETSPSDQDICITSQLVEAGKILNIELIDHIIVCEKSFLSLKEEGYL